MIVALVGKALLHYDGVESDWKPTVADAAAKTCNSACNSTCSLCRDQSCCKLGIHKGHVCNGCANRPRQCIIDCMGEVVLCYVIDQDTENIHGIFAKRTNIHSFVRKHVRTATATILAYGGSLVTGTIVAVGAREGANRV